MSIAECFIDTETTGLDMDVARVWEFAGIRREPDGDETTLHLMVADVDLSDADPQSLDIGGFYERHPVHRHSPLMLGREAVPVPGWQDLPEVVAAKAISWFTRDATIIGANVQYDMHLLRRMMKRHGVLPRWHYRPVDVTGYAAGYLHGYWVATRKHLPERAEEGPFDNGLPWSGARVAAALGLVQEEDTTHTALGDALFVKQVWDYVNGGGR